MLKGFSSSSFSSEKKFRFALHHSLVDKLSNLLSNGVNIIYLHFPQIYGFPTEIRDH